MSNSYWGVDHGVEIAKASSRKLSGPEKVAVPIASTIQAPLPGTGAGVSAAILSRRGRKVPNAARAGGRSFGEAVGGAAAGSILTGGKSRAAASIGALAGGAHGGYAAINNAAKRGDLIPTYKRKSS